VAPHPLCPLRHHTLLRPPSDHPLTHTFGSSSASAIPTFLPLLLTSIRGIGASICPLTACWSHDTSSSMNLPSPLPLQTNPTSPLPTTWTPCSQFDNPSDHHTLLFFCYKYLEDCCCTPHGPGIPVRAIRCFSSMTHTSLIDLPTASSPPPTQVHSHAGPPVYHPNDIARDPHSTKSMVTRHVAGITKPVDRLQLSTTAISRPDFCPESTRRSPLASRYRRVPRPCCPTTPWT
jgi:hypothetical protein